MTDHAPHPPGTIDAAARGAAPCPLLDAAGLTIDTRRRHIGPFDLTVQTGELVALVGPNGSGKTTLLRLALGLEVATSGTSRINGEPVSPRHPPRGVGAVLDVDGLAPWRSARQELEVGCAVVGAPTARVDELLALVGLRRFADHAIREYSRGMRQRLAIAWSLVGRPDLLVLDEPTVALDVDACSWLGDLLGEHVAAGAGAVVATHDHAWLAPLAPRTVLVTDGRLA